MATAQSLHGITQIQVTCVIGIGFSNRLVWGSIRIFILGSCDFILFVYLFKSYFSLYPSYYLFLGCLSYYLRLGYLGYYRHLSLGLLQVLPLHQLTLLINLLGYYLAPGTSRPTTSLLDYLRYYLTFRYYL